MKPDRFSISTQLLDGRDVEIRRSSFIDLEPPLIMGILNVTPDSFSDGGSIGSIDEAVARTKDMIAQGADMIDIGGESTRPFAEPVSLEQEIDRTIPVIEKLVDSVNVPISIDTRHSKVASMALDAGASIVNDVNGLRGTGMEELVLDRGCSAVIMHMKGIPENMQVAPSYDDVIDQIHDFLASRVDHMVSLGASKERLMIDPGIGFGKRVGDNLMILRELDRFMDISCPVLIGASRKSFIGSVLGAEADDRLEGSLASAVIAAMNGASVIRVHDVKETKRALEIFKGVLSPENFI